MKDAILITKEILLNIIMVHRLAINNLVIKYKGNLLGMCWIWINPAFQILIYGLVFGSGIRNNAPVEGVNFFLWLIPGYIMWQYINSCIVPGARSIIGKLNIVTKMKFPVSIVPISLIVSELYIHILMLFTIVVILMISGIYPTIYWLYALYYLFAATIFLFSISIFLSSITTVFRDFQHITYNTMRMLFFLTPLLFPMSSIKNELMLIIMRLNPFTYLLEGYRESFLFGRRAIFLTWKWDIYFWSITLLLYIVGCILHNRMKKNLLDYA